VHGAVHAARPWNRGDEALSKLKQSANARFRDRPGTCKLIETALAAATRPDAASFRTAAHTGRGGPSDIACFGIQLEMANTVAKPKTKVRIKTERPRLHKVILVNDDYTPREFVVTVLKAEFRMTEDQAHKVMITAHRRGVCVVAVFTKDVAETKATRATDAGRTKGYPLLFTTEPEE
jgi:ATP-dependent Clp protease adaptor protein ClpS